MTTHYIAVGNMGLRGWGFRARVVAEPLDGDFTPDPKVYSPQDGKWLQPLDVEMYEAWIIAGRPTDDESLEFYGATKPSRERY